MEIVEWQYSLAPDASQYTLPVSTGIDEYRPMIDPTMEPPYIASVEEVAWGVMLVAISLIIHAVGMILTQRSSNVFKQQIGQPFEERHSFLAGIAPLLLASWLIVMVHFLEILVWAGFFQWRHCFVNYSTAVYFSFLEYTTVGSTFNLPLKWRLLEGMIATAGLLAFAWSTGVLMTVASAFQEEQLRLLRARRAGSRGQKPESGDGRQ